MKIKKPKSAPAAAGGGAAIADRLKLAPVASEPAYKGPTIGKTASLVALIAGIVSLGLVAGLAVMLWKHWEYLMPA